jgi:hypothetical protein
MSFMHIFYSGCLLSFPFSVLLAFLLFFYTRDENRVVGFWGLHVVGFVTDCLVGNVSSDHKLVKRCLKQLCVKI